MIRSQYLSTLAIAALIGAPAFAQTSPSSTMKEPTAATQKAEAKTSAKTKAGTQAQASATTSAAKPLCSELNHPNAGKLADKDTGMAKDNSSSPVHMDCTPDSPTSASAPGATTGDQSLSTNTTTTTGDQSLSSTTSASTGDQSLSSDTSASTDGGTATNGTAATTSTSQAKKKKPDPK